MILRFEHIHRNGTRCIFVFSAHPQNYCRATAAAAKGILYQTCGDSPLVQFTHACHSRPPLTHRNPKPTPSSFQLLTTPMSTRAPLRSVKSQNFAALALSLLLSLLLEKIRYFDPGGQQTWGVCAARFRCRPRHCPPRSVPNHSSPTG